MKKYIVEHFDDKRYQYPVERIIAPPVYVKQEIDELRQRMGKSKKVTEFGSGTGRLTIPLLQNSVKVIAVDRSKSSLGILVKLAKRLGLGSKLQTKTTLPRRSEVIVGCDVLHHIKLEEYLPLFYQNLKKKGRIIFSEPNGWHIFWYLYIWKLGIWEDERGTLFLNYFNLIKRLRSSGFRKIVITSLGLLPGPVLGNSPFWCRVNYWLGNLPLIKLFAFRLIIEARKD